MVLLVSQNLRLFLFQTALGSGADEGFAPLLAEENFGAESLAPPPVFAMRRGRVDDKEDIPGGGVLEPGTDFSIGFGAPPLGLAFDARKVLLTETALKVVGFFAEDADRPCPLSTSLSLDQSVREASVSDPPLKLPSAEFDCSSKLTIGLSGDSSLVVTGRSFSVDTS